MTTLQVQCEVYEQKNFDLTEENKTLNQKFSELESNLNKFERDNKRLTSEVKFLILLLILLIYINVILFYNY